MSAVVLASQGGAGGALGANVGMSAFFPGNSGWGLRVGVTWHKMAYLDGAAWLVEMGLGR